MKLGKYKSTKNIEDRRSQNGSTTFGQAVGIVKDMVVAGAKPAAFASTARMITGYKQDPETFRKGVALPDTQLRKKKR